MISNERSRLDQEVNDLVIKRYRCNLMKVLRLNFQVFEIENLEMKMYSCEQLRKKSLSDSVPILGTF